MTAENGEVKRSRLWKQIMTVTSVLIVITAVFLLFRLFMSNPLQGTWENKEKGLVLIVEGRETVAVKFLKVPEAEVKLQLPYTIDKKEKTITITEGEDSVERAVRLSAGEYKEEALRAALSAVTSTFEYSVDKRRLTLTERDYGERLTFEKQ